MSLLLGEGLHEFYMELALQEAWKYQGLTLPNPAVGALLLGEHGEILSIAAHQRAGSPHAEVLALQEGYARLSGNADILALHDSSQIHDYLLAHSQGIFRHCTLYVTLEPCNHYGQTPPCSELLARLKPKSVIIGKRDPNPKASGGIDRLKEAGIAVHTGIKEEACHKLLLPFERLQKQGYFRFFKWAQRLNGTLSPGIISSSSSRAHVHALRDRIDLLVISGKTARADNPWLDARLIEGRAPDVLILTRSPERFPRSLRLFSVPHRHVRVSSDLEALLDYRCVMAEGGAELFETLFDSMDAFLSYIAPSLERGEVSLASRVPLSLLHSHPIEEDLVAWYAKGRF